MTLQKRLQQNQTIRFYHVSTNPDDFKSFFQKGAKPIGQGVGGQGNGFYVWTNETLAENHICFLNFQQLTNEAVIVGVDVEKESIAYPRWKTDMEYAPGFCSLLAKHHEFINKNMQNLNIDLPPNETFLKSIQSVKCKKENGEINFTFTGKSPFSPTMQQYLKRKETDNPCYGSADSVFFQTLTDYLCQNNPEFLIDYNHFMQQKIQQEGIALKYTGQQNIPISILKYATIDESGKISKTTIYDKEKQSQQICPFVKMAMSRKTK